MTTKNPHRTLAGLDLNAPGGLDRLFAFHRAHFGDARMEADDDGAQGEEQQEQGKADEKPADKGGYAPPASQAELDRIVQARLDRERAKFADYEALRDKATKYDEYRAESATDQERAAAERADELAKARAEAAEAAKTGVLAEVNGEQVVEFARAHLTNRLDAGQLEAFAPTIAAGPFVGEDGRVDFPRLRKHLDTVFPPAKVFTDLGQGSGRGDAPRPDVAPGMGRLREAYTTTP